MNELGKITEVTLLKELLTRKTENGHFLFREASITNKWQDCVYYWKAPIIPKNWKFGCQDYWNFHHDRFDENYTENITGY